MKITLAALLSLIISTTFCAEPLEDGESIYIYCDAQTEAAFKTMKKTYAEPIKAKKLKWKSKRAKDPSYINLSKAIEKELLKSKATRIMLSLGSSEVWDAKKDVATDANLDEIKTALASIITTLKAASIKVSICTPPVIDEGTHSDSKRIVQELADAIRAVAEEQACELCDLHQGFADLLDASEPAERGKGITTKDGIKLNNVGIELVTRLGAKTFSLAGSTLTRKLQKGDVIALASPYRMLKPMGKFSPQLKDQFNEMGVEYPRAVDIGLTREFWKENADEALLKALENGRPKILFVSPGAGMLEDEQTEIGSLEDGRFKTRLEYLIAFVKEKMDVEFFLCTPLLWSERKPENKIVPGGKHFKHCQEWANQIKEVAKKHGVPVIDIHQACLDHFKQHGPEMKKYFAGQERQRGNTTTYMSIDYGPAAGIIAAEIAKVVHAEFDPAKVK